MKRKPICPGSERSHPDPIDQIVGARVRFRRQQLKLSQSALAAAIGVSFQQVQKYEKGQNRIGASTLVRLAGALHAPIGFFLERLAPDIGSDAPILELDNVSYVLAFDFQSISDHDLRHALRVIVRSLADNSPKAKPVLDEANLEEAKLDEAKLDEAKLDEE